MPLEKSKFFAYSWHIDDEETNRTVIRIYGLTEKNKNVCVIVKNFLPYVYIELPPVIEWDDGKAAILVAKLGEMLKERKPVEAKLVTKHKLYYANVTKKTKRKRENDEKESKTVRKLFPYLWCSFSHPEDIKHLGYKLRNPLNLYGIGLQGVKFRIHENNATPILQLISQRKLPSAGWITFTGTRVTGDEQTTFCKYEYDVRWKDLCPEPSDKVVRPLMLGFDIEAYSLVPTAMPVAERPEDKVFQISCVVGRQGSKPETYKKYLLSLGDPDETAFDVQTKCVRYQTEADLLLGFTEMVQTLQPNILIGYNIFGFDIKYMLARAKLLYVVYDFDKIGMVKYKHAKEKKVNWSSSAYKNQNFEFLDIEGMISVDVLPLVRRDHKMSSYTLKNISAHFLKGMTKDDLDHKGIRRCYELGMQGGKKGSKALGICGKYCIKDSDITVRLFEVLTTWIALCEMSKVTSVPIFYLYTQGQQLKLFSQAYKKCTHENTVIERDAYVTKPDDHYIGATVFDPIPGVYDMVTSFDFTSLYPTTIIAYNICWSTLVTDDAVSDDLCHVMEWDEHFGCAHDPNMIRKLKVIDILKERESELKELRSKRDKVKGEKKEEIKVQIADYIRNMKPLRDEKNALKKKEPKQITCCHRKYRWLKEPMGVLPEILTHLLDTRSTTKKEMKGVKGKLKELKPETEEYIETSTYIEVLDQRQLALKVSANSGYGCMGVKKGGYLPFMPGAMCTTYMGRKAIEKAAGSIKKDYKGVLIYGDTDSNYVNFPFLKTAQECWDYSVKVSQEVTKLFPKPMALAFEEKIFYRFMILTKKRYMSLVCERDGKVSEEIAKKGVLLQRRDNSPWIRKIYGEVVMMIFNQTDVNNILDYIVEEINRMFSLTYPVSDFTVTKAVGDIGEGDNKLEPYPAKDKLGKDCFKVGDYKIQTRHLLPENKKDRERMISNKDCTTPKEYYLRCLPAQVQLAEKMRMRGQIVPAGSRLEYVITTTGGHTANQFIKIESAEYFEKHRGSLELDYLYYLKQLTSPLDQVLDIIFDGFLGFQKGFVERQYKLRLAKSKVVQRIKDLFKPRLVFKD